MIKSDVKLSTVTTYKFGGVSKYFLNYDSNTPESVLENLKEYTDSICFIGKGSNLAFSDKGYEGLIVKNDKKGVVRIDESTIEVFSGTYMPDIARFCADNNLSGAEFMIGIPGSIGGGVKMNAGSYGSSVSDLLKTLTTYNYTMSKFKKYSKDDLKFGYRSFSGINKEFIHTTVLELKPEDSSIIRSKQKEYLKHRKETQPTAVYNAGSVFKNPEGLYAGRLIEEAGLKGYSVGGVEVSSKHANFFVAKKGARSLDLYQLVKFVKEKVYENSGTSLEEEIIFIGDFE